MFKTYQAWTQLKILTNAELTRPRSFKAGQIWWCMVGQNIGVEIDGKHANFIRPVLIIKRYSENSFFGVPTTSKVVGDKSYYRKIETGNFKSTLLLSQVRSWDASRLVRKIDNIGRPELRDVCRQLGIFLELVDKNYYSP